MENGETQKFNADSVHVLVAHYDFKNVPMPSIHRAGDAEDVENLRRTFQEKRNCTFRELLSPKKELLLELLGNEDQLLRFFSSRGQVPSVFILYILSHGERKGRILTGGRGAYFTTTEVFESLKNLRNYVKCLKFINFGPCRGDLVDFIFNMRYTSHFDNLESCNITFLPNMHNLVILFSTVETTAAIRDTKAGSWLIQATCQVLDSLTEDKQLPLFLTLIQLKVHLMANNTGTKGQTPEVKLFSQDLNFTISALPRNETESLLSYSTEDENFCEREIFQWRSDSGVNVRGRKAFILFEQLSKQVEQLEKALSVNLSFDTSIWQLNSRNLRFYLQEAARLDPGVGCLVTCLFGQVVKERTLSLDSEVCVLVDGEEFPLVKIVHAFAGPKNGSWIGKPKIFIVVDQKAVLQEYYETATSGTVNAISATHHSGWLVFILQGENHLEELIEIFSGDQLKESKSLQQLLSTLLLDQTGVGKVLYNSTLQYQLKFPDWPRIFIKPDFQVYVTGDFMHKMKSYDELLDMARKEENQVWLLSSEAGAGKSTFFKEFAVDMRRKQPDVKYLIVSLSNIDFEDEMDINRVLANTTNRTPDEIKTDLEARRLILLLDGYDEMYLDHRELALDAIKTHAEKGLTVWISLRQQEAKILRKVFSEATEVQIKSLDYDKQVELLQMVAKKGKEECEMLLDNFSEKDILGNALHLTLIANAVQLVEMDAIRDKVQLSSILLKLLDDIARNNLVDLFNKLQEKFPQLPAMIKSQRKQISAAVTAAVRGHDRILDLLLANGVDVNKVQVTRSLLPQISFSSALQAACTKNDIKCLEVLIRHRVDLSFRFHSGSGWTSAFTMAACSGHVAVAERLHRHNPQLAHEESDSGIGPLHYAAWNRKWEMCEWLVEVAGVNVDRLDPRKCSKECKMGREPRFWRGNDWVAHDHLMMLRGDVSVKDPRGKTALHCAAQYGRFELVQRLLHLGGDPKAKDDNGHNVLYHACMYGQVEVAKFLHSKDKDLVKEITNDGSTALHLFVKKLPYIVLFSKSLLRWIAEENVVDVNAKDSEGRTALHVACIRGTLDIAQGLIDLWTDRLDVRATDVYGRNALHLAAKSGKLNVVQFLLEIDIKLLTETPLPVPIEELTRDRFIKSLLSRYIMEIENDEQRL